MNDCMWNCHDQPWKPKAALKTLPFLMELCEDCHHRSRRPSWARKHLLSFKRSRSGTKTMQTKFRADDTSRMGFFFFFPFRELSMHHALLDLRRHINWIGYPFRALTWPIDVAWDVQAATPSTGSELVVTSLVSNLLQLIKILYQERDVSARAKMFVTFSFFSLEIIKRDHLTVP